MPKLGPGPAPAAGAPQGAATGAAAENPKPVAPELLGVAAAGAELTCCCCGGATKEPKAGTEGAALLAAAGAGAAHPNLACRMQEGSGTRPRVMCARRVWSCQRGEVGPPNKMGRGRGSLQPAAGTCQRNPDPDLGAHRRSAVRSGVARPRRPEWGVACPGREAGAKGRCGLHRTGRTASMGRGVGVGIQSLADFNCIRASPPPRHTNTRAPRRATAGKRRPLLTSQPSTCNWYI